VCASGQHLGGHYFCYKNITALFRQYNHALPGDNPNQPENNPNQPEDNPNQPEDNPNQPEFLTGAIQNHRRGCCRVSNF
jgi:hypothetical protein